MFWLNVFITFGHRGCTDSQFTQVMTSWFLSALWGNDHRQQQNGFLCIIVCRLCVNGSCSETAQSYQLLWFLPFTANYSTPVVTVVHCNESEGGKNCMVTCSSSGGYPNKSVTWTFQPQVAGNQWEEVKSSSVLNKVTKLYTVSGRIFINCSQPLKITCTVGGVVSEQEEVCEYWAHCLVLDLLKVLKFYFQHDGILRLYLQTSMFVHAALRLEELCKTHS